MQPKDLRVKGSTGGELHLLEWSSEGVPMLLLHGFGNEAHIWDDFAPIVAPHYRTLALDHRGHGQSDWDREGRYDIDSLVDDVESAASVGGPPERHAPGKCMANTQNLNLQFISHCRISQLLCGDYAVFQTS